MSINSFKPMEEKDYTEKIKNKLDLIQDEELKGLIERLVDERNYLINISNIDPLTGAYNRRILNQIRDYSSIVVCDIDNFKGVNDRYGHHMGDEALKLVAKTLMDNCRINDYVCRFGGDEFVIVFCGADEKIVKERMENVANIIRNSGLLQNEQITLSMGMSSIKENIQTTIKAADQALYTSKEAGKDRITSYTDIEQQKEESIHL